MSLEQTRPDGAWDPFDDKAARLQAERSQLAERLHVDAQRARVSGVAAVFAPPHAEAWLRDRRQAETEQPSYRPGDSLDLVAWREGRKSVWAELVAELEHSRGPAASQEG